MLTSNQSHRLPQRGKAPLQACKCKQAASSLTTQATSEKRHRTETPRLQPTCLACYQTSHTRSIEKDSAPLIPGEIDRLDPAQLFCLSTTRPLPPRTHYILFQHHRHRHLTRRSPTIQLPSTLPPGWLAWAWVTCGPPGGVHTLDPGRWEIPFPRGHVPGSFVGWESLALLQGRLIARAARD